jgi:hypothetical protein
MRTSVARISSVRAAGVRWTLCALALVVLSLTCTRPPHSVPENAPANSTSLAAPIPTVLLPAPQADMGEPPVDDASEAAAIPVHHGEPQPRVTVDVTDIHFPLKFPTSISARGDLVAGVVEVSGGSEYLFPVWVRIKRVGTDETVHLIDLFGPDLISMLSRDCRDRGSLVPSCPHLPELEQRAEAANAVLAKYEWRRFPCYHDTGPSGPEHFEPGCDRFRDATVTYETPSLHVSLPGRVLLDQERSTWGRPRTRCSVTAWGASMAFDPKTGIFLVLVSFSADGCACPASPSEFHPIRMPSLRDDSFRHGGRSAP